MATRTRSKTLKAPRMAALTTIIEQVLDDDDEDEKEEDEDEENQKKDESETEEEESPFKRPSTPARKSYNGVEVRKFFKRGRSDELDHSRRGGAKKGLYEDGMVASTPKRKFVPRQTQSERKPAKPRTRRRPLMSISKCNDRTKPRGDPWGDAARKNPGFSEWLEKTNSQIAKAENTELSIVKESRKDQERIVSDWLLNKTI